MYFGLDLFQMSSDFKNPSSSVNSAGNTSRCTSLHSRCSDSSEVPQVNPAGPTANKNDHLIPLQWLEGKLHCSTVLSRFIDFVISDLFSEDFQISSKISSSKFYDNPSSWKFFTYRNANKQLVICPGEQGWHGG